MTNTDFVRSKNRDILTRKTSIRKFTDDGLSYKYYDNAIVFPFKSFTVGGICDKNGVYINNTSLHERLENKVYHYKDEDINNSDDEVVFIGTLCNIYGHAITDNLKKIWFLRTETYRNLIQKGCKTIYLNCIYSYPLSVLVLQILKYSGVKVEEICEVRQLTRYKKIYIPDDSLKYDPITDIRYYTKEFKITIDNIKRNISFKGKRYDKLYFSRSHFSSSKDIGNGEVIIEKLFSGQGFKVIYPEKHSFEEQVEMLMHCNCFAASEGSISHNAIFCKNGTNLIILRKSNWINPYQLVINEMINANTIYVDTHHSIIKKKEPWFGPFYMYPTKELQNLFNIRNIRIRNIWLKSDWYTYLFEVLKFRFNRSLPFIYSIAMNIKHTF